MLIKTVELRNEAWRFLQKNEDLNGFHSEDEFDEEFERLGEVSGDGKKSYFTRKDPERDFEVGNVRIVNVDCPADYERVHEPAIKL